MNDPSRLLYFFFPNTLRLKGTPKKSSISNASKIIFNYELKSWFLFNPIIIWMLLIVLKNFEGVWFLFLKLFELRIPSRVSVKISKS